MRGGRLGEPPSAVASDLGNDILGLVREVPNKDGSPLANSTDANGLPYTTLGYAHGPGHRGSGMRPNLSSVDTTDMNFLQEAAVPLGSETHAGEDVPIYARGPKAHLVGGTMEQNWIFHVMMEALRHGGHFRGRDRD